ncbi:hypothetical protein [Dictyobacter alpinus]|nr:hypothetical protein [Dictyobacter alpinus]
MPVQDHVEATEQRVDVRAIMIANRDIGEGGGDGDHDRQHER